MLGEICFKECCIHNVLVIAQFVQTNVTDTVAAASNHSPAGCGIHTFPKQPGVASGSLTDP